MSCEPNGRGACMYQFVSVAGSTLVPQWIYGPLNPDTQCPQLMWLPQRHAHTKGWNDDIWSKPAQPVDPPIGPLHWWTKPRISHLSVLTHFMVKYTFYKVSAAHAQEVKRWWKSHHVKWGEFIIKWLTKTPLPPVSTLIRTLKGPLSVSNERQG